MYSRYPVFVSLFYRNAINNHYQMIIGKRVATLGITKAGKFYNGVGPKPIQSINFMEKLLNKLKTFLLKNHLPEIHFLISDFIVNPNHN